MPSATPAAIEFHHAGFDHYFVTTVFAEISSLDSGALGGWARTGQTFKVFQVNCAGLVRRLSLLQRCVRAEELAFLHAVRRPSATSVKADPSWQFEGEVFALTSPDGAGNCAGGTAPLFRLYNNGRSGAPNHRYTTSAADPQPDARGGMGCRRDSARWAMIGCVPV